MTMQPTQPKKIALIGATGNIGSHILKEALERGHHVTGIVRNIEGLAAQPHLTPCQADLGSEDFVCSPPLAEHDIAIVSIKWIGIDAARVIARLKRAGVRRVMFVVGAGSLRMPDGRTWYEHNLERGTAPPSSGPALAAFEEIRRVNELEWTAISPPASIKSGERTGRYRTGLDELLVDGNGESRISYQDFAVAVLDEVEAGKQIGRRFTVAYC